MQRNGFLWQLCGQGAARLVPQHPSTTLEWALGRGLSRKVPVRMPLEQQFKRGWSPYESSRFKDLFSGTRYLVGPAIMIVASGTGA